jgi:hypothetical protein
MFQKICADRCTIGAVPQCGWQGPGTVAPAYCALTDGWSFGVPQTVGDYGYCAQTCDCDAECTAPSTHCNAFDDPELASTLQKKGVCSTVQLKPPLACP